MEQEERKIRRKKAYKKKRGIKNNCNIFSVISIHMPVRKQFFSLSLSPSHKNYAKR
jgi:hypothetical protein